MKLKGCYAFGDQLEIHKNHSMQVVANAAVQLLTIGQDPLDFLQSHTEIRDFLVTVKVPKSNKLYLGDDEIQKTGRYLVTNDGEKLMKVMPPTGVPGHYKKAAKVPKKKYEECDNTIHNPDIHTANMSTHQTRYQDILSGFLVVDANDLSTVTMDDINWDFYKKEVDKITLSLLQ